MNDWKKLVVITGVFLVVASCGKKQSTNTELTIGFAAQQSYAIDAVATSCEALHNYKVAVAACRTSGNCSSAPVLATGGVAGPYVSFGRMKMEWTRAEPLTVIYVKFTFRSNVLSGGKYEYTFADKNLFVTWRQGPNFDPPSNPLLPNTVQDTVANGITTPQWSDCEVVVPSLPISRKDTTTTVPGSALVYGFYTNADSTQVPIFANSDAVGAIWTATPPAN